MKNIFCEKLYKFFLGELGGKSPIFLKMKFKAFKGGVKDTALSWSKK